MRLLPFALAFVVGCAAHKPAAPMQPLTGGELNTARRDHITVLAEWLTKHKYD